MYGYGLKWTPPPSRSRSFLGTRKGGTPDSAVIHRLSELAEHNPAPRGPAVLQSTRPCAFAAWSPDSLSVQVRFPSFSCCLRIQIWLSLSTCYVIACPIAILHGLLYPATGTALSRHNTRSSLSDTGQQRASGPTSASQTRETTVFRIYKFARATVHGPPRRSYSIERDTIVCTM